MANTSELIYHTLGELNETPVQTPVPQATSTIGRTQFCAGLGAGETALLSRNERRDRNSLVSNVSSLGLLPVDSLEEFSDESGDIERFMARSSSHESDEDDDDAVRLRARLAGLSTPKSANRRKPGAPRDREAWLVAVGPALKPVDSDENTVTRDITTNPQPNTSARTPAAARNVSQTDIFNGRPQPRDTSYRAIDSFKANASNVSRLDIAKECPQSRSVLMSNAAENAAKAPQPRDRLRETSFLADDPVEPNASGVSKLDDSEACLSRDASYVAADLRKRKERELALRSIRRTEQMQRRRESDELTGRRAAGAGANGAVRDADLVVAANDFEADAVENVETNDGRPFNPFSSSVVDFTVSDEKFFPADSSLFRAELEADEAAPCAVTPLDDRPPLPDLSQLADATQADVSAMEAYFSTGTEPVGALGGARGRPCFGRVIRSPVKSMRAQPPIESIAEVSRSESQGRTSADNAENVSPHRSENGLCSRASDSSARFLKDNSNIREPSPKNFVRGSLISQFDDLLKDPEADKEAKRGKDSKKSKRAVLRKSSSPNTRNRAETLAIGDLIDLSTKENEIEPTLPDGTFDLTDNHERNEVELSAWDGDAESEASDSGWIMLDGTAPAACPHVAALADESRRPPPEPPAPSQPSRRHPSAGKTPTKKPVVAAENSACVSPRSSAGSGAGSSAPHVRTTERDLVWTTVALGQRHPKALVIQNPFERSARLVASVPIDSAFRIVGENGELSERRRFVMAANEVCKLKVVFAPTAPGPHAAALAFAPAAAGSSDTPRMVRLMGCAGQSRLRVSGATRDAGGQHLLSLTGAAGPARIHADFTLRNVGEAAMFAHLALTSQGMKVLQEDELRVVPSRVVVPPGSSVQCRIIYQASRAELGVRQLARLSVTWGEETTRLRLRRLARRHPTAAAELARGYGALPAALAATFDGEAPVQGLGGLPDPQKCARALFDSLHELHVSVLLDGGDDSSCADADASAYDATLLFQSMHEHPNSDVSAAAPDWSVEPSTVFLSPTSSCRASVRNTSACAQTFEVAFGCAWLRVAPAQGCVEPGAAVDLTLTCVAQPRALIPATTTVQVLMENDMREIEVHLRPAKLVALPPVSSTSGANRHARSVPEPSTPAPRTKSHKRSTPAPDQAGHVPSDGRDASAVREWDTDEGSPLGPCGGLRSLVAAVFSDNYRIEFPPTEVGKVAQFKVSLKNTADETRTMQIRGLAPPFYARPLSYQLVGKWFLRFKVHFKPTQLGVCAQHVFIDPDVGPPLHFYVSGCGVEAETETGSLTH